MRLVEWFALVVGLSTCTCVYIGLAFAGLDGPTVPTVSKPTTLKVNLTSLLGYHDTALTHVLFIIQNDYDAVIETISTHWVKFPPCHPQEQDEVCQPSNNLSPKLILASALPLPMINLPRCFSSVSICQVELGNELEGIWNRACFTPGELVGFVLVMEPSMRPVKENWLSILQRSLAFPNPNLLLSPSITSKLIPGVTFTLDWNNAIYNFARQPVPGLAQIATMYQASFHDFDKFKSDNYNILRWQFLHLIRVNPFLAHSLELCTHSTLFCKSCDNLPIPTTVVDIKKSLTHVIIAFHNSNASINKLRETVNVWWKHFPPCIANTKHWQCTGGALPHLVFLRMVDYKETKDMGQDQAEFFANTFPNHTLDTCFASHTLCTLRLNQSESTYMTGSRITFESFLTRHHPLGDCPETIMAGAEYGMYMESDLKPVKHAWLTTLQYRVRYSAPFNILGSVFRGQDAYSRTLPSNRHRYHINSNAVYDLTTFPAIYFTQIRPFIVERTRMGEETAMDLDIFHYLLDNRKDLVPRAKLLTQIQYTNLISNKYRDNWQVAEFASKRIPTLLVHGGNVNK
ncbi:hypothetical protein BASA81_005636 [Batrachochytrium salamandrivorans]|nr:hypothetical protein BASA81_005636 [Batrachochytrium salamandrivorans]